MSAEDPVVSVIIPAFNRNHTLRRALTSVIDQSFRDLEIIVVDDGSAQPVEQVVASFNDARIRVLVHETNRGANVARNTGIRAARGEYVAFLDSDDEWDKSKLELQVKALERAPFSVGAHYTGYTAFLEDGTVHFQRFPVYSGNLLSLLLRRNEIGTLSSLMVRRSVLEVVGWFDENLPSVQDWDLYIRIAKEYEFATIGEPLLRYYFGRDSITRNLKAKALGLDMFLEKYESEMSQMPSALAAQMVEAGHYYCRSGSVSEGRHMFFRAIRIHPFAVRSYSLFVLSLLGGRIYDGAVSFRHKVFPFV